MVGKSVYIGRVATYIGASWSQFGVGFSVTSYSFSLDLGFVFIVLEW